VGAFGHDDEREVLSRRLALGDLAKMPS